MSVIMPAKSIAKARLDGFAASGAKDLAPSGRRNHDAWFASVDSALHRQGAFSDECLRRRIVEPARKIWTERVSGLSRDQLLVADPKRGDIRLRDVAIPVGSYTTAAVTVQPPPGAKPGDRFRFDIIQRRSDGTIVGGSSYVLAVRTPSTTPAK
jgi:hypothetical protein